MALPRTRVLCAFHFVFIVKPKRTFRIDILFELIISKQKFGQIKTGR